MCSNRSAMCSRTGGRLSLMQNGLFLVAFYPLYFPFLATGSAGDGSNGLLAVQDGWQEAFCFRVPRRGLMR